MPSQEADHTVRKATRDEATVVAGALGDAFFDDPVMRWLVPRDERRKAEVTNYFRVFAQKLYLAHDEVYLAPGAAGAAMWLPPGVAADALPSLAMLGLFGRLFWASGLTGVRRAQAISSAMRTHHPSAPHYYLHALGVCRAQQGRGIGSALLRHMAERCDREKALAYLENSNERNLPLYQRHGFRVVSEWRAAGGGPTIWFMLRGQGPGC